MPGLKVITNDIVIPKLGSSTLIDARNGERRFSEAFGDVADGVNALHHQGVDSVLVSSGAIATAMAITGLDQLPKTETDIEELQRLAAIGWRPLLNRWSEALNRDKTAKRRFVAELLLTKHELVDAESGETRDKALHTINKSLQHGDVPIVNENDAIADDEIRYGDNDILGGELAGEIAVSDLFSGTVTLVLLSDVEGVYAKKDDPKSVIKEIQDIEEARERFVYKTTVPEGVGRGEMTSKFDAAEIARAAGVKTIIANGRGGKDIIQRALAGEVGTQFPV